MHYFIYIYITKFCSILKVLHRKCTVNNIWGPNIKLLGKHKRISERRNYNQLKLDWPMFEGTWVNLLAHEARWSNSTPVHHQNALDVSFSVYEKRYFKMCFRCLWLEAPYFTLFIVAIHSLSQAYIHNICYGINLNIKYFWR